VRIIAGAAKGTVLAVPRGGNVRPTSDRVREAIFSSLGDRVTGASVLDLFAGTGALGLEAASRGAASVIFVERSPQAVAVLEKNVLSVRRSPGVKTEVRVLRGNVFRQLAKLNRQFSIIFADPPYGAAAQLLLADDLLPGLLAPGAVLVLESAKRDLLRIEAPWQIGRENIYGDTRVTFIRADSAGQ
jgi:16S rRNA (guanine966-N2)-methyltransferase